MQTRLRFLLGTVLAVSITLTGCGGGGHTSAPLPMSSSGSTTAQSARLTITIDAPPTASSTHRSAKYLSAATQSLTANITPQGSTTSIAGYPQTVNLTPTSNGCSSTLASTQCSLTLSVPVGSYNVTIATYDGTNGTGNMLSAAQSLPVTIMPGIVNTLGISLGGVPTSARIVAGSAAISGDPVNGFVLATGGSANVSVFGVDADGNYIVGVGAPTVTLGSSDSTQFTVTPTSAAAPNQFTIANVTSAAAALVTLTATVTPASQSGAAPLTQTANLYSQSPIIAPTLTAIGNNIVVPGQVALVTLTGTNFNVPNTFVNVIGSGVTAATISATSTSLVAQLTVSSSVTPGTTLQLTVTTANGTSLASQPVVVAPLTSVTRNDDTAAGTPPGTGTGVPGDLRYAMLHAAAGATLTFPDCISCVLSLKGPLPPITQNLSIDGTGAAGEATMDEGSAYRLFFVDTGTVAFSNMHVQNVAALGGAGGTGISATDIPNAKVDYSGNGGGGAGLGAAIFVNQSGAVVSVTNVTFSGCKAVGGSAPFTPGMTNLARWLDGGGGGGLGGGGGNADITNGLSAGGGGGVLSSATGLNGGYGGGAGAYSSAVAPGSSGAAYATDSGASGSAGGFGGGGAGGAGGPNPISNVVSSEVVGAGAGGFGAGGGGADAVSSPAPVSGGAGGPGGGGGGGSSYYAFGIATTISTAGGPGGSLGTVSGGNGGVGSGGGGAAAGPVIFVNAGTLVITGSTATNVSASGGRYGVLEGSAMGATSGTSDATPVYNYAGSVNGSTANGPVAGAL